MWIRWEYIIFVFISIGASLFAKAVVRDDWPVGVKRFFRYVVPVLIFFVLSFYFVLTGQRFEDWAAKSLFCWAYPFEACIASNGVRNSSPISSVQNAPPISSVQNAPPISSVQNAPPISSVQNAPPISSVQNAPPVNSAPTTERIFLTVTPDDLLNLYNDRTISEGLELTRVYLGKWMRLSGPLDGIRGPNQFGDISITFKTSERRLIFIRFNRDWTDRLAVLAPDKIISVVCQLKDVNAMDLELEKCELTSD